MHAPCLLTLLWRSLGSSYLVEKKVVNLTSSLAVLFLSLFVCEYTYCFKRSPRTKEVSFCHFPWRNVKSGCYRKASLPGALAQTWKWVTRTQHRKQPVRWRIILLHQLVGAGGTWSQSPGVGSWASQVVNTHTHS